MKPALLTPVLLLTFVVFVGGHNSQTHSGRQSRSEAQLRGLLEELVGAASATRQNGVERSIADGFVYIDASGRGVRKRTFLEELKAGRLRLEKGPDFRLFLSGKRANMSGLRLVSVRRGCERLGVNGITLSSPTEQEKWVLLEHQLLRRANLVPVLFEVLKAAGIWEAEYYDQLAETRSKLLNLIHAPQEGGRSAATAGAVLRANDDFNSSLSRAFSLPESYPQLRSSEPYLIVTDELYRTERRIGDAACEYSVVAGHGLRGQTTSEERVSLGWVRMSTRGGGSIANGSRWQLERVSGVEVGGGNPVAGGGTSNNGIHPTPHHEASHAH